MSIDQDRLWNLVRLRTFTFDERADGDEIPCVVSTDAPVDRGGYVEILSHLPGAVDLTRAPLPLIDSHKSDAPPFGVVDQLHVQGGKMRGVVKFGNTQRAQELLADVKGGILRSVSIAYQIIKQVVDGNRLIATRWMPYEVSCVAVPADPGAGFYRSKDTEMEISEERERAAGIVRTARMFDSDATALDAIEAGESLSAYRQRAMLNSVTRPAALGLSRTELRRYSLSRALAGMSQPPGLKHDSFEWEVSEEMRRRFTNGYGGQIVESQTGLLIPPDIAANLLTRDLTAANAVAGGYLVSTQNLPTWVELARPRSVALSLGVESLDGLTSSLSIARELAGPSVTWHATEASEANESTPTLGQVSLSPKIAGTYCEFSRQLLLQSSPAVDRFIARSLLRALGVAIDIAVLNGSGIAGQPTGILNTAGIGSVTGTSLALAGVLEFQADAADALAPSCGYATTRAVAKLLAERQKATGTSSFLWEGSLYEGELGGYRSMSSGNMPTGTLLFGDWASVLLASWGTLTVEINPFANFKNSIIGARVLHALDVGMLRPAAFSAASSVT